jgi:transcriptional regulator with XRE-family HTH domain
MDGADYIRSARLQAGLTQAELGARSGHAQSEITRWENGRARASFETVRDLVRACGYELVMTETLSDGQ